VELRPRLIVDGLNVLGARPDGWWRDRPAAMVRLVERLERLAEREGIAVEVVFDGREHATVAAAASRIGVGFAPGGPNAADREIAARARAAADPGEILVVSSDRRLRASIKAAGAASVGAGEFTRAWLD
jgi:predicted RNA-binding protein with PIN domain